MVCKSFICKCSHLYCSSMCWLPQQMLWLLLNPQPQWWSSKLEKDWKRNISVPQWCCGFFFCVFYLDVVYETESRHMILRQKKRQKDSQRNNNYEVTLLLPWLIVGARCIRGVSLCHCWVSRYWFSSLWCSCSEVKPLAVVTMSHLAWKKVVPWFVNIMRSQKGHRGTAVRSWCPEVSFI